MITKETLIELLNSHLERSKNIFLVEVKNTPNKKIKIFLDSMTTISLEDCVTVSRWLENKLDREIEDFELEVSSAGIGSPFKVAQQYEKAIGKQVEVALKDGRKVNGILCEKQAKYISLETEKKIIVESKKKKQTVQELMKIDLSDVNTTKEIITF